jgi:hypothetical protein
MLPTWLARIFTGMGVALAAMVVVKAELHSTSDYLFAAGFIAGPWLLPVAFAFRGWRPRGTTAAALLMLLFEAMIYYDVFVHPSSSTAALAYVFKPLIQVLVLLPVGIFISWPFDPSVAKK